MEPILDGTSGRGRVKPRGQTAGAILVLLLGLGAARADNTTNFMGDFGEAFWTRQPQYGSVNFSNSDTEIAIAGPTTPPTGGTSYDGILYNSPLSGGLVVGGTLSFHWAYSSGDAQSTSGAEFAWDDATAVPLGPGGGPGVTASGDYPPLLISPGTTNLSFLLITTPSGTSKLSATLIITDFQFDPAPEPSTSVLLGGALISLGAARGWRSRRRVSGQL